MHGLDWREQDGKRYLRVDYTIARDQDWLLAISREADRVILQAAPGQRLLAVIDGVSSGDLVELARHGLKNFRQVHQPRRTLISAAGMPRSAATLLRSFNALGARGRIAGFPNEPEALDWLLAH